MALEGLPNETRVAAWMNPPEHVVEADALVEEAFEAMQRANIRHLLVMQGDELIGVVTDHDLRRPKWLDEDITSARNVYRLGDDLRVRQVMTENVLTAQPDDPIAHAARVMVTNKFNCLPVVKDDKVVGILTSSDLLAALVYEVDPDYADLSG